MGQENISTILRDAIHAANVARIRSERMTRPEVPAVKRQPGPGSYSIVAPREVNR